MRENQMVEKDNNYTKMQISTYETLIERGSDKVIGNDIGALNNWPWMKLLFDDKDMSEKVGLDFGAGPGRNIKEFGNKFRRLDGVDLSIKMRDLAKNYIGDSVREYFYYVCNGVDLAEIFDNTYDFIMSTIAMQHICVYDIRYNYFKEFYRILKPGGFITIQMGFGYRLGASDYYANDYDLIGTNGDHDVSITDASLLEKDLTEIGFHNFTYEIAQTHPSDLHANWIFFKATK